jgi:2-polyprenyl-3-methyl-5-hydroxy-6-metoxy-1,4-benzoquinol methylase
MGDMLKIFKKLLKRIPFVKRITESFDNQISRDEFVSGALAKIPAGKILLDAGCGGQRYRESCNHLVYKTQDFGQFEVDETPSLGAFKEKYKYGKLDYTGNIWDIEEDDETFDAILCTEVFEHIAYPNETIKEFFRLLKPGGKLILTAPSNCLRHMDPYFFYSGFSNRWYEEILPKNGFKIDKINPDGDYYSWLRAELGRTITSGNFFAAIFLFPSFAYFSFKNKTQESTATLCGGYHVLATKHG